MHTFNICLHVRIRRNGAPAEFGKQHWYRGEIRSQIDRPIVILLPFQIQIGPGKRRFEKELREILARAGHSSSGGILLTQRLKRLGKEIIHARKMALRISFCTSRSSSGFRISIVIALRLPPFCRTNPAQASREEPAFNLTYWPNSRVRRPSVNQNEERREYGESTLKTPLFDAITP
jgi:hypothetical protein